MEDLRSVVLLRVCAQGPIESNTEFIMIEDLVPVILRVYCEWLLLDSLVVGHMAVLLCTVYMRLIVIK